MAQAVGHSFEAKPHLMMFQTKQKLNTGTYAFTLSVCTLDSKVLQ